jgi:transcription elongation factor Elf1
LREFLARCPACGHRFTVKVKGKKLLDTEQRTERLIHDVVVNSLGEDEHVVPAGVRVEEIPTETKTFEVTFECHRCHHEWSVKVTTVEKLD